MGLFVVLAQPLAVVSDDDDQGPIEQRALAQERDDPPDLMIEEGDLSGIAILSERRGEGLGRVVGSMRIEEVHPGEEGGFWCLVMVSGEPKRARRR